MKKIIYLNLLISFFLLTSCASSYKNLNPQNANFSSSSKNENGVSLSYEYLTFNKKYAKKANNKDIKTAAVKVQNNTDKEITYGSDFKIVTSENEYLTLLPTNNVYENIKQRPGTHFWYLLLTPIRSYKSETQSDGSIDSTSSPIGLLLGPTIALGNFLAAKGANDKFNKEINQYSIYNKSIAPNESKIFLISIRHSSYPSIKAELIK